ncbi:Alpha-hydroxy acid dehydrogenase FMN-dependent protein [Dioscorea alata]|uniref:Alpha-hydroxy acid dehydrogenase FMN-dependent protein n=1 Tax=Dioscorea alata TaxID=55571 RepID=A0ACB7UCH6_DIOAL|nr:Alpha-hydroxy acid dehydrogenase FMN-dependent protein [Dioscorea alata]
MAMVLSFASHCTIEEVASSCDAVRFYQLFFWKQRDVCITLVKRAESNGFKAIVLTIDAPRLDRREADLKNKFVIPRFANLEGLLSANVKSIGFFSRRKRESIFKSSADPKGKVSDAQNCIELDPSFSKGYIKKGSCQCKYRL